jgi:hypothetical protein
MEVVKFSIAAKIYYHITSYEYVNIYLQVKTFNGLFLGGQKPYPH